MRSHYQIINTKNSYDTIIGMSVMRSHTFFHNRTISVFNFYFYE